MPENSKYFTNFALMNPAMRGASEEERHRVLGGSLHTKGVYCALFLAFRNLRNFEFATKDDAIVDAPWVRLCTVLFVL